MFLLAERLELLAVVGLLPGFGNGQAQGGQSAANGQQLLDQVGQRRVGPFGGQDGPLGEHFLGHGLAVEDPARRAQGDLGIGPLVQPQRQGDVKLRFILGLQEGQLFFFAQDGQGAGHVAADDPPLPSVSATASDQRSVAACRMARLFRLIATSG